MSQAAPGRRIALASGNTHKAAEWQTLMSGWQVETLDMSAAPPERGLSFAENALAKARYGANLALPRSWVLGEDSGLEVDALGGAPGIRSARYAGSGASDEDNVALLLRELEGTGGRAARFQCAAACIAPGGEVLQVEGSVDGEIALAPRGRAGFGYDPVFIPSGEMQTVAELGEFWKQASSHRARAAEALLGLIGDG